LFQNLNLRFEEGKIIALAGESGCGKSTLQPDLWFLDWESGEIIFDGKNFRDLKEIWFPEKLK
jgi:ABC-type lipoprotein export system ATPase subunit